MKKISSPSLVILISLILLSLNACHYPQKLTQKRTTSDLILALMPEPQSGFKWIAFKNVMLQRPAKWSEYKTDKVYTSSIESVAKSGKFEIGITINQVDNVSKRKGISASQYAVIYMEAFKKDKNNKKIKLTFGQYNGYNTAIFRYRNAPKNLTPIIVHKFILANDEKDHVMVITFESPEKQWEENWQRYGFIAMKYISIK